jgi:NADH dehydrogenase
MKKKIAIIGCGFAGAFSSRALCHLKEDAQVTVIDKKETFDFLPMLPDAVGRGIDPGLMSYPISLLSNRWGFNYINEEVKSVDIQQNAIITTSNSLNYDYLIISSGSETNFYGNNEIREYAYKLDDASDARRILKYLEENTPDTILISGGGYTGVEVATNLRVYLNKKARKSKIIIIERAPSILGPLPEWMKSYVGNNLKELGVEVFTNTVIDKISKETVSLSNSQVFNNAMLIWVAGVKTADFIQSIKAEKNPQGRIKVDDCLRLKDNCFIVGDCAYVAHKNGYLRMAVQFAIYQAISAANNIAASMKGKKALKYKPLDMGYVIPMANNKSCGSIMGINVTGMPATLMHFTMCIYRSLGARHKSGIVASLLTPKHKGTLA